MSSLWIFGDNNSAIFGKTKERRFKYYKEYRGGTFPKSWSELLSNKLGYTLRNMAVSGQSNYDIMEMICKCAPQIKKNDIVIIGWGYLQRFRLIDEASNSFVTIRPNQFKPSDVNIPMLLNGININTINSILDNRTHIEWKNEIYNWESIINLLASIVGFKVLYWTFDSNLNKQSYIGGEFSDFREYLISIGAEDFTIESNGIFNDDHFGEKGQLIQYQYFIEKI